MIRKILLWPDPILRKESKPVAPGESVNELVRDLVDTMDHAGGIGLAAIQIGVPKRVFVLRLAPNKPLEIYINPQITGRSPETEMLSEGCLSLPGVYENVRRHTWVNVTNDAPFPEGGTLAQGLRAQAIQHEIEHLNGKLYVDKKDPGFKDRLRAHMKRQRGGV